MALSKLPLDILFELTDLLPTSSLNALLLTNRSVHSSLTPYLHRRATTDKDEMNPLCWASKHGHESLVRLLLRLLPAPWHGARPATITTPLVWATENGHASIVALFLSQTSGIYIPDSKDLLTSFQVATVEGDYEITRMLLDGGVDVDSRHFGGCISVLETVAQAGHSHIMDLLLERGADTATAGSYEESPALCIAASLGFEDVVQCLVSQRPNDSRHMAIALAVKEGHTVVVEILAQGGVDIDEIVDMEQSPLLHSAVYYRQGVSMVETLLDLGASVNLLDEYGETALMSAYMMYQDDVCCLLMGRGADMLICPKSLYGVNDVTFGRKALYWLWRGECPQFMEIVFEKLLAEWADVDEKALLKQAVRFQHEEMEQFLLARDSGGVRWK